MNTDINTNTRLFDLVRYMRSELHEAELITDEEYAWLSGGSPMAKGSGSPSPRRLEDYDRIRAQMNRMEGALKSILDVKCDYTSPEIYHRKVKDLAAEALNPE